jgi:hypothetical protein
VTVRFFLAMSILLLAGCAPKPDAGVAERAITLHFEQRGYLVKDITIGNISRNPIAEREYMAPLTYVVKVPSIVLKLKAGAGDVSAYRKTKRLNFSTTSFNIQALSPPKQGWAVSRVTGVDLP